MSRCPGVQFQPACAACKAAISIFVHLHHRLHDAAGLRGIGIAHQFAERGGDHLPGETEFVLYPTALSWLATFGEFLPEKIDLFLRLAVDQKGDCFGEFEMRTTVQRDELRPSSRKLPVIIAPAGPGAPSGIRLMPRISEFLNMET